MSMPGDDLDPTLVKPEHTTEKERPADEATLVKGSEEETAIDFQQLVAPLTEEQREVLRLRHVDRWPLSRIAEHLKVTAAEAAGLLLAGTRALDDTTTDRTDQDDEATLADQTLADDQAAARLADCMQRADEGQTVAWNELSTGASSDLSTYIEAAAKLDRAAIALGETLRDSHHEAALAATLGTPKTNKPPAAALGGLGETFGDYELLSTIAKGGMGVVYKARQKKLNRTVALKMILAGRFADQQDIDRFYTEAEAAGNLRHPNIVSIYEVGEVDGQHFFSMDYVEGKSLADLVRECTVESRRAAQLTKTIAEAMQFAHEKGIVHRDLKPANVLLDEQGTPLVTDFGLAKRVAEPSGMTMSGAILGTPSYMPPEQAAARTSDVGPQSDVYSLGAILYEFIAGKPPFRSSTPLDTVRQVIESEPVAPRTLNPALPRDLETICLKCLQKDIAARYQTAQELADELARFLAGEPIKARPISRASRAWRWCRRNPVIAASSSIAVAGVLAALVATAIALMTKSQALTDVQEAQQRDQESYQQARKAVDEGFTQISEYELLNQPGMQRLRRDLLERTLAYYQQFLEQRGDDPRIQDELAVTHYRIGLINLAIGTTEESLTSLDTARALAKAQIETDATPDRRLTLSNIQVATGKALQRAGRLDAALGAQREALAIRHRLFEESPGAAEFNLEIQRKLANSVMNVGLAEHALGELDEALANLRKAQEIRFDCVPIAPDTRQYRDGAKGMFNIAVVLLDLAEDALLRGNEHKANERRHEAISELESAAEAFQDLFKAAPDDFGNQIRLARTRTLLASVLTQSGEAAAQSKAIHLYDEARPVIETLARMNPDVAEYQNELATLNLDLGMVHWYESQPDQALPALESAQRILDQLVEKYPNQPDYQFDLAASLQATATMHAELENWSQAKMDLDRADDIATRLAAEYPDDAHYASLAEDLKTAKGELLRLETESKE